MAQIIWGERAARAGRLTIGCAAVIFSDDRTAVLLTRRQDNGRWCLPGGHMEAGERADEACAREVREETGRRCASASSSACTPTPTAS